MTRAKSLAGRCLTDRARWDTAAVPYSAALAVTVIVEVPIYLGLGRWVLRPADGNGLRWYGAVNLVSHPMLWYGLAPAGVTLLGATGGVLAAEGLVTAGEGLAISRLAAARPPAALAVAALANVASFRVGLTLASAVG
jgi:hypothetical protein